MSVFSDRLKQLRLDKGENQSDVAAVLGVSVQSYSAYEGSREPKYELLCKLAQHFNVTTDYLLGLEDGINRENSSIMEATKLTNESVLSIKKLQKVFWKTENGDNRHLIDVFNLFMECKNIEEFLGYMQLLTYAKNIQYAWVGWEGQPMEPIVHLPDKNDLAGINPNSKFFQDRAKMAYYKEALHNTLDEILKEMGKIAWDRTKRVNSGN